MSGFPEALSWVAAHQKEQETPSVLRVETDFLEQADHAE
jgi:hypothetical protein